MAEEYVKLLDEARKKFARGEDASDLIPKITEALSKMTKEAREAALKSPGMTPEEANTELGVLWLEATLAWIGAEALALVGSYIPFTNAAPVLAKAFDAPELKWRVDAAMQGIALKTDARLLKPLTRYYNKEYLPNVVDVATTLELHKRGYFGDTVYLDRMASLGYSPTEADNYVDASMILPGLRDITAMRWRGLVNDDTLKAQVKKLGYAPLDADRMIAIQEPIPGSGDLINFVVKEAFPLADLPDAPSEFKSWMSKQGYSESWSKAYWYVHWRLVPEGAVLDLWHRGYINTEEATKYLVLHDFLTFKRPGQSKTDTEMVLENSYSLLPRIDLRFGWFTGTLTEDEIKTLYAKYGFKAEDAAKEVEIQKARVLEIYRRGYLSTLQLAYRRGKITADAFRSRVVSEKFPIGVADWILKTEDLRISLGTGVEASNEERALTKSDLIRLYRRGLIDQARLKSELANLNYSAAEVALLVADADYAAPTEARFAPPTTSEIMEIYELGLRDEAWARENLAAQGNSLHRINMIMLASNAKKAKATAAAAKAEAEKQAVKLTPPSTSEIMGLYELGLRDEKWAREYLAAGGNDAARIDILILESNAKKIKPLTLPSASEALDAFEKGFKDEAWTRAQLQAQNYAQTRIDLLVEAVKAKKTFEAQAAAKGTVKVSEIGLSQIEAMYKGGILSWGAANNLLISIGYSESTRVLISRLWDSKVVAKPRELSLSELQFAWENNLITDSSLSSRVAAMGYTAEDAALMTRLTKARALENERNRLVSITESRFKMGLGTEEEAGNFLNSLGYVEERRGIIIGAWRMERDLGIATDTRDAWLKAYSKGQSRESVYGYLTEVLKLNADVVNALLLLEDAKLLKA